MLDRQSLPSPTATTVSSSPPPAPDPTGSPLGQFLVHPGATLGRWVRHLVGPLLDLQW